MQNYDEQFFNITSDDLLVYSSKVSKLEDEIFKTTFRNSIIVGVSEIDFLLEDLLKLKLRNFRHEKNDFVKTMNFSSKINLCYGIGIIGDSFTRVLHKLRKIRNGFAHKPNMSEEDLELFEILNDNFYGNSSIYTMLIVSLHNEYYNDKIKSDTETKIIAVLILIITLLYIKSTRITRLGDFDVIELNLNKKKA